MKSFEDIPRTEWDLSVELVDAAEGCVPLPGTDILPSTISDYDDQTLRRITTQLASTGLL